MSSYRQGEIQKHLTLFPMLNVFLEYPGGGLGIYTDRDQRSNFGGFEFRKSVFFWVLVKAAVFFGLSNKCCIFKCFMS